MRVCTSLIHHVKSWWDTLKTLVSNQDGISVPVWPAAQIVTCAVLITQSLPHWLKHATSGMPQGCNTTALQQIEHLPPATRPAQCANAVTKLLYGCQGVEPVDTAGMQNIPNPSTTAVDKVEPGEHH